MKQYVTKEQVNKLIYINWDEFLHNVDLYTNEQIEVGITYKEISEKMTIGVMIQIIDLVYEDLLIDRPNDYSWSVQCCLIPEYYEYEIDITRIELCDALWEVVVLYLEDNYMI